MNNIFYENYMIIKKCFPEEYSNRHALGAFLCMINNHDTGKIIERERIMQCRKILNSKVNLSAAFRDYLKLPLVIKMALSDNPEKYLEGITQLFNNIKSTYFTGSGQKFITAMAIYDNSSEESRMQNCRGMYDVYNKMKEKHPVLTGQEDMMFAALLQLDGEDHDHLAVEIEECYQLLRNRFKLSMNPLQNVSHVLSLTDIAPEEKVNKFIELYELLKDRKKPTGLGPQLIVLSVLSVLDVSVTDSVNAVIMTDSFLKNIKGFGKMGINQRTRKMIAIALTAARYLPEDDVELHDVRIRLLKTILNTAMISGIIVTRSTLEMSAHR